MFTRSSFAVALVGSLIWDETPDFLFPVENRQACLAALNHCLPGEGMLHLWKML